MYTYVNMGRRQGRSTPEPIRIEELDFSHADELEDHIALRGHAVRLSEIQEVFTDEPKLMRDRDGYLLVGMTLGGRLLTVPVAPTDTPRRWRPKTAFDAAKEERTKYAK